MKGRGGGGMREKYALCMLYRERGNIGRGGCFLMGVGDWMESFLMGGGVERVF